MKLIRGSYAYIIGLFILGVCAAVALGAFICALFAYSTEPNPLLSEFGSSVESGVVTMVASTALIVFTMFCSAFTLWSALRRNSLDRPMTVISVMLFFYAATLLTTTLLYGVEEALIFRILRCTRCLPPLILGVLLILMTRGRTKLKVPAIILSAVSGATSFAGYGMYKIFIYDGASAKALRGYISLLLFSAAMFFFFAGLCCFIAGSEARRGK
ncbi:MAG: hypothetical protein IJU52_07530 [Clostridia bacterium]|nr:hypothetical protein [Clostridia bacterium]